VADFLIIPKELKWNSYVRREGKKKYRKKGENE
jgi:hypothetical protein